VDKVAEATRIVRERQPDLSVDGPLQDAAAIASVGQAKRPGGPVAGRASVFVYPDRETGNTTYKPCSAERGWSASARCSRAWPSRVNDLSRGALVEDIIYTIALTAIQARAT
jgi:phosphate acetyltransferase